MLARGACSRSGDEQSQWLRLEKNITACDTGIDLQSEWLGLVKIVTGCCTGIGRRGDSAARKMNEVYSLVGGKARLPYQLGLSILEGMRLFVIVGQA